MMGNTGAAPSSHEIAQFLNSLLSQRGPQALPYVEDDKWSIRQHLLVVLEQFPGLQVKAAEFTHNDGRTSNLLQLDGLIPMLYQKVQYNIPITLWLLEAYPREAPRVFVNPTPDMVIKRQHPFVDGSGMVHSLHIQRWEYPRSSIVELVQGLSLLFRQDPPLYTKPNTASVRPPIHSGGSVQTSSPSAEFPWPPYRHDPQEQYKKSLATSLTERVNQNVNQMVQERTNEMETVFHTQSLLAQRSDQLRNGVRELVEEKEALENQLQTNLTNIAILENWLRANDKGVTGVNIDDVFEPVDTLSKQLLECQASDLAIEDILYAMDKSAQDLVVPVEAYLKHVRVLAREQFFHRAASQRIRQVQVSSRVESMASWAPPPYAS